MPQVVGFAGYGDALTTGVLVERDGCLFLERTGSRPQLIIWPPGFAAAWIENELVVLDATGSVFARVGEPATLGGERLRPRDLAQHSQPDPTGYCQASRYWIASPEKPTADMG